MLHVPQDIPILSYDPVPAVDYELLPYVDTLELPQGRNMAETMIKANVTFYTGGSLPAQHQSQHYYIELRGLVPGETYHVRVCWSALNPVGVKQLKYVVVPRGDVFQGTISTQTPRIFVQFALISDYYLLRSQHIRKQVPLQIHLVNVKLGIPVDCYPMILYLLLLVGSIAYLGTKCDLYRIFLRA